MLVRQLIGRLAGTVIEMPFAEAQACLATGTVAKFDAPVAVKGLQVSTLPPPPAAPAVKAEMKPVARAVMPAFTRSSPKR
ncbi:MAG TPA: hypothetical protein VMX97_16550 [Hyphomicrobiaceae bacterium]|nr:hypothetical protein [Hyphomicrobiaceae bacterium]